MTSKLIYVAYLPEGVTAGNIITFIYLFKDNKEVKVIGRDWGFVTMFSKGFKELDAILIPTGPKKLNDFLTDPRFYGQGLYLTDQYDYSLLNNRCIRTFGILNPEDYTFTKAEKCGTEADISSYAAVLFIGDELIKANKIKREKVEKEGKWRKEMENKSLLNPKKISYILNYSNIKYILMASDEWETKTNDPNFWRGIFSNLQVHPKYQ